MKKIFIWCYLVVLLSGLMLLPAPTTYPQSGEEIATRAQELLKEIPKLKGDEIWDKTKEIERLGKDIRPAIESGLKDTQPIIRLASAKIIYRLGGKQEGVVTILGLLREEKDKEIQILASELLGLLVRNDSGYGDKEDVAKAIEKRLDNVLEPTVRLNLARDLFYINRSLRSITDLRDLLKISGAKTASGELKYPQLRAETALALGELGYFEEVKDILKELAREPGRSGRVAQTLIENDRLTQDLVRKTTPKTKYDYRILDEIFNLIRDKYVDPKKFNPDDLIVAAAKGITESLDKFSAYQTEEEKKRAAEELHKRYGGIGSYVNMRDDWLTIERPIYSGPAYKAGLRSLDKITEIEGVSTKGKPIDELIKKLKGEPGTEVKIKVYRKGWTEEREFILTRAVIQIKTARAAVLPGDIGYLEIVTFGETTAEDTAECLKYLNDKGVKSIILNLRGNSGGLLDEVVDILEMFLEKDKVIITTKEKNGQVIDKILTAKDDKIDLPVYVLVDNGSASGSEIVAGVLQDYKRGILIGQPTYGKGSVQKPFDLASTDRKSTLKLTIAKYYLPSNRCIHREANGAGGLDPDIKIAEAPRDPWKDYAFAKVYDSDLLRKYREEHYARNKELFSQLAEDDGYDSKKYPGFTELYDNLKENLQIHLSEAEVREILRDYIRRLVADDRKEEFLFDLQTDIQLQRAIVEALKGLKVDAETIPAYKPFAHKFDKPEEAVK